MKNSKTNCESGHALVELAIVAFVLFVIAFWAVEISRVLRFQQLATALSRELASVVYRECLADDEAFPTPRTAAPSTRFDPRRCIPALMADADRWPAINSIAPGARIAVSYYGYDGTDVTRDYYYADTGMSSRFDPTNVRSDVLGPAGSRTQLGNAIANLGVVIVGEVQLPYQNLGLGSGLFVNYFIDWLYGVTIL